MSLLDRDAILAYLTEVAHELPADEHETVVIVGGSMLALLGLRDATKDVDTARQASQSLSAAATRVAQRHDLAPGWLNSAASAWVPDDDIVPLIDTAAVLTLSTLSVYTASADAVFVMKAHAARPQDYPDLAALWPLCSFESFAAAAEACNAAYAHLAAPDEHLAELLRAVVQRDH
jgi:hypothetical protein